MALNPCSGTLFDMAVEDGSTRGSSRLTPEELANVLALRSTKLVTELYDWQKARVSGEESRGIRAEQKAAGLFPPASG